jgi:hypothetical protein
MKSVVAVSLTATALVFAPVASADVFDMDKYDAELKQGGVDPDTDYANENAAIVAGLISCNGVSEKGRDAWLKGLAASKVLSLHQETVVTDAALDVFCPQLKGR